jgi:thioredoxin 1
MILEVTDSNFEELLKLEKPLVLDFWAEWCGPCRMISPVIDELAKEYEGRVTIGKLNVDTNNDVVTRFSVRSVPTILFFKGGAVVDKVVGAAQRSTFIEKIDALLE